VQQYGRSPELHRICKSAHIVWCRRSEVLTGMGISFDHHKCAHDYIKYDEFVHTEQKCLSNAEVPLSHFVVCFCCIFRVLRPCTSLGLIKRPLTPEIQPVPRFFNDCSSRKRERPHQGWYQNEVDTEAKYFPMAPLRWIVWYHNTSLNSKFPSTGALTNSSLLVGLWLSFTTVH